jgi:hypothetical protein
MIKSTDRRLAENKTFDPVHTFKLSILNETGQKPLIMTYLYNPVKLTIEQVVKELVRKGKLKIEIDDRNGNYEVLED